VKHHETLTELLNAPEGEHYQFKEWKNKENYIETTKILCALANCGGGKLVLGISDKRPRQVVGSTAFSQPERVRADLIEKLRVGVDFVLYEDNGKRVLTLEVSSHPVGLPITVDGVAWWYVGDSLVAMPENVRRSIYAEGGNDFSAEIVGGAALSDLDDNATTVFRKTWATNSGNKRIETMTKEQLLRDSGAVTDAGVTYAALILFGTREAVRKYLPRAEVVFEYRSSEASGPAAWREEFTEGFFNYNDRIWELVNLRNDKQHYQDGLFVFPVSTFNERVTREALLNSITHRDYQLAGSVFVRQYHNRLVVESPGGFPTGITLDNILDRQSPRNMLIAKIFQLCGLVERSGQGMNLIYELAVREAKPLPDFHGTDAYFVKLTLNGQVIDKRMLVLMKQIGDERLDAMTTDDYLLLSKLFTGSELERTTLKQFTHLIELGIVKQTESGIEFANGILAISSDHQAITSDHQAIDWRTLETDDKKQQIISFIAESNKVTSAQLVKLTGLSQGHIRKILQSFVADGVIVKFGNNRYATYELKRE
jgi:ATP-dependent DNA helicase RecG